MRWITGERMMELAELSMEEQIKELDSFLVTMMDLNEQTEREDIYIKLHETLRGKMG